MCVVQYALSCTPFYGSVRANASGGLEGVSERFIHGAPAFAPLLFANLSLLAGLGIWELQASRADRVGRAGGGLSSTSGELSQRRVQG